MLGTLCNSHCFLISGMTRCWHHVKRKKHVPSLLFFKLFVGVHHILQANNGPSSVTIHFHTLFAGGQSQKIKAVQL